MCKISVIIPIYNVEKYVGKCVESILNQTLKDFELILIDDGSTDGSIAVIENSIARYTQSNGDAEHIRMIQQANAGVSAARNRGLELANGEYVAFIDSDDYVAVDYLEQLYGAALKNDSDMVYCGYIYTSEDGTTLQKKVVGGDGESERYRHMAPWGRIIRKKFIEEYNLRFPLDTRGEDLPFMMMVNAYGKGITAITYSGYYYLQREASAMKQMVGLAYNKFPIEQIADVLEHAKRYPCYNSYALLELSALRSYAMILFQFGRRAPKESIYMLANEIKYNLDKAVPNCYNNQALSRIRSLKEFGLVPSVATNLFAKAYKHHCLPQFAYFVTRF